MTLASTTTLETEAARAGSVQRLVVPISVLFARRDSIYKTLPGCDVWDIERDALNWPGGTPIVAHPPCRGWGRFATWSNASDEEKQLAVWSVEQLHEWGGVVEHPEHSRLWATLNLPKPGCRDARGFTLEVEQHWWGHLATKPTWLYVCGCTPADVPPMPIRLGEGTHAIACDRRPGVNSRNRGKPELPRPMREHTPLEFAKWLVELARRTTITTPTHRTLSRIGSEITALQGKAQSPLVYPAQANPQLAGGQAERCANGHND